jgi:hypothetical protein
VSKNMRLLVIGGCGLAVGTALALVFPEAGGIPGTAMMLILCMSAALCGASVPGFIRMESKLVRAGGATVFFVLPWLLPYEGGDEAVGDDPQDVAVLAPDAASPPKPAPGSPAAPAGGAERSAVRRPATTFKPPPLPAEKQPAPKPASKPIGRPRTIFDGLFKQSAPTHPK